jgi:hypothetical protein
MTSLALAAALLLQAPPIVRTMGFTALTNKGAPVAEVPIDEVALLENGVVREVVRVEADTRPLALVVILDDSLATGAGFRLDLIGAVEGFLKKMPPGTRYSLWLTADRPERVIEWSDQPTDAGQVLRRTVPRGANTIIDALAEAPRDLARREGERTAVVAITATGPEMSHRDKVRAVEEALPLAEIFLVVQIREGEQNFEALEAQGYVLDRLTRETGGRFEETLTTSGATAVLDRVGALLLAQHHIAYRTEPDLKQRKVELKLARPDLRVTVIPEKRAAR